ncbi:MAG: hypothetical protein QHJ81_15965 [Anaerolineae bacterium]|nr:hypothetical protein [Anaerolineae bacterium]
MTLYELIQDIHALDRELQRYEEKYSLLSEDFYELYISGKLRDENIEEIDDYGSWAAFYRMRQQRRRKYDELKESTLRTLRVSAPESVALRPYAVPVEA